MKKIALVMGSDSDLPVIQKSVDVLSSFEVPFEVHVYSAHRTPQEAKTFAENARENGFGVIIAAAGMAAHLAGAIAANTTLPVIGIPCASAYFDGMDALSFHRANAVGDTCGNRCGKRRRQRSSSCLANACRYGRNSCRKA